MPFLQMGVANPVTLYMHVLQKGFGVKDASMFIMPNAVSGGGPPQQGDPTAQPQEVNAPGKGGPSMDPNQQQQMAALPPAGGGGPPPAPEAAAAPATMGPQQMAAMSMTNGAPL